MKERASSRSHFQGVEFKLSPGLARLEGWREEKLNCRFQEGIESPKIWLTSETEQRLGASSDR